MILPGRPERLWGKEAVAMTPLVWLAIALMLGGAVLLIADVGVEGLWIAVITVGIALSVVERARARRS